MKVALVVMPWVDVEMTPLGVATLKAFLKARGVDVDVFHLHLKMAGGIGASMATFLARSDTPWPEWFFSYHLFGPGGTAELAHGPESGEVAVRLRGLSEASRIPEARWRDLLEEDVPRFLSACERDVPWQEYDVVGFSSGMYSHLACLALSQRVKRLAPGATIVFGGPNVEGPMGLAALNGCPWIDYVVDGEGENAFAALLEELAAGHRPQSLPGVHGRTAEGRPSPSRRPAPAIDMAGLPPPDHDDYFEQLRSAERLVEVSPRLCFETSRGCWWGQKHHCAFCGIEDGALVYRSQPGETAARQIWALHERYKANDMHGCDLILDTKAWDGLLPELARLRQERGSDVEFYFESKANLSEPQVRALAEAGVTRLQPGIETFSTPILKLMKKGVRGIQNVQTLKFAASHGVRVFWNLLYGFPGEREEDYLRLIELLPSLSHLQPPAACAPVRPDRFSPYREAAGTFGLAEPQPADAYRLLYPSGRFDLAETAYFFEFVERPSAALSGLHRRLRTLAERWAVLWTRNYFAYRRGPSCLELFDSRPLGGGGGLECRRHLLTGLDAFLLRVCGEVKTIGQLASACGSGGFSVSDAELRARLDELEARRWLLREDGFYLCLAVPFSRLPAAQRAAFEGLVESSRKLSGGLYPGVERQAVK